MHTKLITAAGRYYVVRADASDFLDPHRDRRDLAAAYVAGPFRKRSRARRQVVLANMISGARETGDQAAA